MLDVQRLTSSIRYRLSDMQGARYSDFDVLEAINRAASLLFGRMGARFVWAAVKKVVVVVHDEAGARLPRDFHGMRRVTRENVGRTDPGYRTGDYRIVGSEFRAEPGAYGLEYYYIPRDVHSLDAELDAPEAVSPWLEQTAIAVLNGDMAGAAQIAESCCDTIAGGEAGRIPEFGPVQILGGRL